MTDALREKLVDAGRVLVSEDQGDYVAGHVTLRLPGGDGRFLMKPAGIGLEEMTPDGIITVDREGERIDGTMPRHNEVFIHSEILRVRPTLQPSFIPTRRTPWRSHRSGGRCCRSATTVRSSTTACRSSPRPRTSSSIRHAARRWHAALAIARR